MQPPAARAPGAQEPPLQAAPPVNWSTKNPICLQLEQRLVQEGSRSSQTRDRLPAIEAELRQVEHAYEQSESDLERYDCYEYFLFSKSLRRTRALRRPRAAARGHQAQDRRAGGAAPADRRVGRTVLSRRHRARAGAQQLRRQLHAGGAPLRAQRRRDSHRSGRTRARAASRAAGRPSAARIPAPPTAPCASACATAITSR